MGYNLMPLSGRGYSIRITINVVNKIEVVNRHYFLGNQHSAGFPLPPAALCVIWLQKHVPKKTNPERQQMCEVMHGASYPPKPRSRSCEIFYRDSCPTNKLTTSRWPPPVVFVDCCLLFIFAAKSLYLEALHHPPLGGRATKITGSFIFS